MKIPCRFHASALLVSGVCALSLGGCVERKITIGSKPAGALVTLNDEEIGRTPVTVPFTWYGDYNIVLRLEKNVGTARHPDIKHYYLHTHQRAYPPPFEWLGIDLFAELAPSHFTDHKFWAFPIPEVREPTNDALIQHARELKAQLNTPAALQNKKPPAATQGH